MTEYVRTEEERLDDIKMGRDAKARKEKEAQQQPQSETKVTPEMKLEVALTSLTESKTHVLELTKQVNLLKADLVGLQAQLKDRNDLIKKLSFTSANIPVDKQVEHFMRELEKFRGLYQVYESFIVGDKGFQTVICDPLTRRCWLDEGLYPQEEHDKKLVKAYRDMQARNEIDTKIVAEQEPEALHIE